MLWLLLEALVALLLAVFIVWFTMGDKRVRNDRDAAPRIPDDNAKAPDAKDGKD